jgi:hypothetical protein
VVDHWRLCTALYIRNSPNGFVTVLVIDRRIDAAPVATGIRPGINDLSVGIAMPRRFREYDRPRAGQGCRRDPVKLSVLPLANPP